MTRDQSRVFWTHVLQVGECWEWTARRIWKGYGRVRIEGKDVATHRYAWSLLHGPIPDGMWVLHTCDNPPCVNPEHLFLGTALDNVRDMISKGRKVKSGGKSFGSRNAAAKLTEDQVRQIRSLAEQGAKHSMLARRFGVAQGTIRRVVRRELWSRVT